MVELLLEYGADPNCNDDFTPLSITYTTKRESWYEISLLLIKSGSSLDYMTWYSGKNSSILQDIVQRSYIPDNEEEVMIAFKYALENCDHSKVNWMRVLQDSVSFDRVEIVNLLLDEGYCDVNNTSAGMTALMFAARDSNNEMIDLLLAYGADKTILSDEGKTAYDYAIEYGHTEIAEMLKP